MKINDKIEAQGAISAPAFYESSLRELKENIKAFQGDALDLVNSLDVVTFDRKDKSAMDKIGVIIDDTPAEFANEEHTAVDLYKTVFVLSKALQELSKKVKELEDGRR